MKTKKLLFAMLLFLGIQNGCDDMKADAYKNLYEKQVAVTDSLMIKAQILQSNIDQLYAVSSAKIDSLKGVGSILQTKISNLNNKIDSLTIFYADITRARDRVDTMLTVINNGVLDYIRRLRIK